MSDIRDYLETIRGMIEDAIQSLDAPPEPEVDIEGMAALHGADAEAEPEPDEGPDVDV